jgi:hypothetical protein
VEDIVRCEEKDGCDLRTDFRPHVIVNSFKNSQQFKWIEIGLREMVEGQGRDRNVENKSSRRIGVE